MLHPCIVSPERKRKKKKRNNDLVVLPSHDRHSAMSLEGFKIISLNVMSTGVQDLYLARHLLSYLLLP